MPASRCLEHFAHLPTVTWKALGKSFEELAFEQAQIPFEPLGDLDLLAMMLRTEFVKMVCNQQHELKPGNIKKLHRRRATRKLKFLILKIFL